MDLTSQIAAERNVSVDEKGYEDAMELQKAAGRAAWKGSGESSVDDLFHSIAKTAGVDSASMT